MTTELLKLHIVNKSKRNILFIAEVYPALSNVKTARTFLFGIFFKQDLQWGKGTKLRVHG